MILFLRIMVKLKKENSNIEPRTLLFASLFCSILIVSNLIGFNKFIYSYIDAGLNPFLAAGNSFAFNAKTLIDETLDKGSILKQNIDLKRNIAQYEELKVQNENLKSQIKLLESQTGIEALKQKSLKIVSIIGVQNAFSSKPELIIRAGSKDGIQKNDVVLYEANTLLGFVSEVFDNSSRVILYYSPDLNFKIPVQNVSDPTQKGFIGPIQNGSIKIKNVPKDKDPKVGDLWYTSNDVAEVPDSLIVGKIKKVTSDPLDTFYNIDIEVPFSLNETNYVFIVK